MNMEPTLMEEAPSHHLAMMMGIRMSALQGSIDGAASLKESVTSAEDDDTSYMHQSNASLPQAVHVDEEVEAGIENEEIPHAVEYDPDSKQRQSYYQQMMTMEKKDRLKLFTLVVIVLIFLVGGVFATIYTTRRVRRSKSINSIVSLLPREKLGIKERIESIVGTDVLDENELATEKSPYRKALHWITHEDPLQSVPEDPDFLQRYFAAYFYFATSIDQPWQSCNPTSLGGEGSVEDQEGDNGDGEKDEGEKDERDTCTFVTLVSDESTIWDSKESNKWLGKQPTCEWAGIQCDIFGQIEGIRLGGSNMTGVFPEGIRFFPFLTTLEIPYGFLRGSLPVETVSQMKHIVFLDLSRHSFGGRIPSDWWSTRNLSRLLVKQNRLIGPIPAEIRHLRDAKDLLLSGNALVGTIPDEIAQLRSMNHLHLDYNKLTGTIPTVIMPVLQSLQLQHNQITGGVPSDIGRLSSLQTIRVHHNPLGGSIPEEFYELKSLRYAHLNNCNLTGNLSPRVGDMVGLWFLHLENNLLEGEIPTVISNLEALERLHVSGNNFLGSMPEEICMLRGGYVLSELVADCRPRDGTKAEVSCADSCCTMCCDADGNGCLPT